MPCLPHSRTADNPWPEMPRVFKTDYGQEEAFELYHQDPRDYCIMSKEFIGKNGKVDKLRLCQIDWQKEDGRLIPVEIAGTEQIVSAQLVLLAMGFIGTETQLFDEFKFARSEANTIAANDNDYMTSIPGIFAAGDARRGQSLVVWAIAEGRGAAAIRVCSIFGSCRRRLPRLFITEKALACFITASAFYTSFKFQTSGGTA